MISFLRGIIISKAIKKIVVLTQAGVGYEVNVGRGQWTVDSGVEVELYTYLKVSENSMELFGFETIEEKEFFELLLSVKGIGPRGGLNILGLGSIEEIKNAISRSDISYLTQVSGIGRKTAERLCVELKEKISRLVDQKTGGHLTGDKLGEVIGGLVSMGYSKEEVRDVVSKLECEGKNTGKLLKEALKLLG